MTTPGGSKNLSKFILEDFKQLRTQSSFCLKRSSSSLCKQGFDFTLHVHIEKKHTANGKYLAESQLSLFKLKRRVSWSKRT